MALGREAIRAEFEAEGISVRQWARDNGYNPRTVYAVLYGTIKCTRGVSHDIAVALGIKAKPSSTLLRRSTVG